MKLIHNCRIILILKKTARENADAQLQTNIDTLSNDVFHKNQVVPIANSGTGASDANSALTNLFGDMRWYYDYSISEPDVILGTGVTFNREPERYYNDLFFYFVGGFNVNIHGTYKNGNNEVFRILLKGNHKNTSLKGFCVWGDSFKASYKVENNYLIIYFYLAGVINKDGIGIKTPNLIIL